MLHIHNGDSAAGIAKESTMPGEHFAWREALIEGPAPADVAGGEWRKLRALHLSEFVDLFPRFAGAEPAYGFGDAQFWISLRQISNAPKPLLKISNGNSSNLKLSLEKIQHSAFEITSAGAAVLNSQADFVEMNGIDLWLGGVHLVGKKDLWRWDDEHKRLTHASG